MPMSQLTLIARSFAFSSCAKGEKFFAEGAVVLRTTRDTQVIAFVRSGQGVQVQLKSDSVTSPDIEAKCSCAQHRRGQLCAHVWAVVFALDQTQATFLNAKCSVVLPQKPESSTKKSFLPGPTAARKAAAAAYRKEIYQKRKLAQKEKTSSRKKRVFLQRPELDPEILAAFAYFSQNGFVLTQPLDRQELHAAWKSLARVFHPDKGGTHDEALSLSTHYRTLQALLKDTTD